MPKLSDTMEEGKILKWLKKEGERVEQGEVIAEVESDKADMELEAYDSGILLKIVIPEGKGAPVGGVIAVIGEENEKVEDTDGDGKAGGEEEKEKEKEKPRKEERDGEAKKQEKEGKDDSSAEKDKEPEQKKPETKTAEESEGTDGIRRISPLARRMADEHEIELKNLKGSGPEGRIVKRDIEEYLRSGKKPKTEEARIPEAGESIELSGMRKAIARRMVESKTTVPHFYLTVEIDMDRLIDARRRINDMLKDAKISFTDIIIKLAGIGLTNHPRVNSYWAGDSIKRRDGVHVGLAVALDDGLITPVVRNVDRKGIIQISTEAKELAERARAKKLKPEEFEGGCLTISNLGMYGIEQFSAIINPPESSILAIGSIEQKPVVKNGEIVAGNTMRVTMSCDHRLVDGAVGAEFLRDFKRMLEDPVMSLL